MLSVEKRNGILVPFDSQRIIDAINKAFVEVDGELYEEDTARDIADEIKYKVRNSEKLVTVEDIQNWIENYLMASERKDVARAYIRYRYKREVARNGGDAFFKAYSQKIGAQDIENQNANVDERSFGGRVGAGSDLVMKKFALDYCVSSMARRNHENNEIYIHDLSSYAIGNHNCLSVPFDKLLAEGFTTRQTDVRPAGSVNTAMQLVAVIFQLQSLEQFGGVSATHLDWTMVPYVRKSFYKHYYNALIYLAEDNQGDGLYLPQEYWLDDFNDFILTMPSIDDEYFHKYSHFYRYAMDMTEREVHQAVEGLYHNLK